MKPTPEELLDEAVETVTASPRAGWALVEAGLFEPVTADDVAEALDEREAARDAEDAHRAIMRAWAP